VTVERLRSPEFWDELLFREDGYGRWGRRKLAAYRQLVEGGEVGETVEDYAASRLALGPPHRRLLNKADGRKKVVFTFAGADELLLKGLNRILQSTTAMDHSRLCHSFQSGRGPRTAYRDIRRIRGLQRMHCLHLDVRDFFNSIPVEPLIASLPATITGDEPLYRLLAMTLRDQRVRSGDEVIVDTHKGVMAGTPLAPLLSNLYLRSLDDAFEQAGVPFLRYAWEFLGLRYERGAIDLAGNSVGKLRRRVRRIARKARSRQDPARAAVRRLNRRLYGMGGRSTDFTWGSWFFPLLTVDDTLHRLDRLIQDQLRFAVTGVHSRRNFKEVSYERLRGVGYLPLVSAYRAYQRGSAEYDALLESSTGKLQHGTSEVAS